jgi:hypothetical protein
MKDPVGSIGQFLIAIIVFVFAIAGIWWAITAH